jgi:hypothetical protein
MTFLKTIILFLFSFNLKAQVEAILKDPNIVWAAEFEIDFTIDKRHPLDIVHTNDIGIVKYVWQDDWEFAETENFFSNILFNHLKRDTFEVFKDKNLTKPIDSYLSTLRIDTNIVVDPITYETKSCRWLTPYESTEVVKYRVHQILCYNKEEARFVLKSIALAPLVAVYKDNKLDSLRPLFWFKTDNERPDISQKSVIWAQRFKHSIKLNEVSVLKNTLNQSPLVHQFEIFNTDEKTPFYSPIYVTINPMEDNIPLNVRENFISIVDTSKGNIVVHKLSSDSIQKLRLVEEWFWDKDSKKLLIHIVATAPLISINDEAGNFLFDKPLFYRKTKDD